MSFAQKYGPWALVAGASEGIGAAFAAALAARGLSVALVARRARPLAALAERLPTPSLVIPADLSTVEGLEQVFEATGDREVGLVVCNAAYVPMGKFLDLDPADTRRSVAVNCQAPLALAHRYLPAMAQRRRGGLHQHAHPARRVAGDEPVVGG